MAQLFRMVNQLDSSGTQTFTFILPAAILDVGQQGVPEVVSRDFLFGGLKWRVSFGKRDGVHLSPYLSLTSTSDGVRCTLDYAFVLVNRESFSKNETFSEKQREFTPEHPSFGHRTFVTMEDLKHRKFTDRKGELVVDVSLRNLRCRFEQILVLGDLRPVTSAKGKVVEALDYQRYDTKRFVYGDMEWQMVFCPNMDITPDGRNRHLVQLNRVEPRRTEILCRLRYRIMLGVEPRVLKSEALEQVIDFSGNSDGWYFTHDYLQFTNQGNCLNVSIDLLSFSLVSQATMNLFAQNKAVTMLRDKDRQAWAVTGSLDGSAAGADRLTFRLVYADMHNVPAHYIRHVCWSLRVVAAKPTRILHQEAVDSPFENYYLSRRDPDDGVLVDMGISSHELRAADSIWLDEDGRLTIQLEWIHSYLLAHSCYHTYDDIFKRQVYQMRREVQALQSENYSLEKELHNYQMSISNKCGAPGASSAPMPERARRSSSAMERIEMRQASRHRQNGAVSPGEGMELIHQTSGDSSAGYVSHKSSRSESRDSLIPQHAVIANHHPIVPTVTDSPARTAGLTRTVVDGREEMLTSYVPSMPDRSCDAMQDRALDNLDMHTSAANYGSRRLSHLDRVLKDEFGTTNSLRMAVNGGHRGSLPMAPMDRHSQDEISGRRTSLTPAASPPNRSPNAASVTAGSKHRSPDVSKRTSRQYREGTAPFDDYDDGYSPRRDRGSPSLPQRQPPVDNNFDYYYDRYGGGGRTHISDRIEQSDRMKGDTYRSPSRSLPPQPPYAGRRRYYE